MRILVTGSSGFVGHAIVKQLCTILPDTYQIFATDKAQADYPDRCHFIQGNLSEVLVKLKDSSEPVTIIHCMVDISPGDNLKNIRTKNFGIFKQLINFAVDIQSPYFLMISSSSVASGKEPMPIKEEISESPKDAYGQIRLEMEQYLERQSGATALRFGILRPHYILGPNRGGIFYSLIDRMKQGKTIFLPYSVRNAQQVLDIEDLVQFAILFIQQKQQGIYNIGTHTENSLYSYLIQLHEHLGSTSKIRVLPCLLTRILAVISDKLGMNLFGPDRHLVNKNGFELCNKKIIEHTGKTFMNSESHTWNNLIRTLKPNDSDQ